METNNTPIVYIVDDDDELRRALRILIESVGLEVRGFAGANEFLNGYVPDRPGCLLLDLRMPQIGGLELQQRMLARGIQIPVVVVTGYPEVHAAVRAMKAGALDFIEKPFSDHALLERVQHAVQVAVESFAETARHRAIREKIDQLTPRESQVMDFVVDGLANKQIAGRLGLSERTVEIHRSQVMKKLAVDSVADLVRAALAARDPAGIPEFRRANPGFHPE